MLCLRSCSCFDPLDNFFEDRDALERMAKLSSRNVPVKQRNGSMLHMSALWLPVESQGQKPSPRSACR